MIVNGVKLPDPDIGDPDFIEKFENAQQRCSESFTEVANKDVKWSEKVRSQCIAVFEFFEEVFGEGAAKQVFGDSVNLRICVDAYAEASNGVRALDKDLAAHFRSMGENINRQQRRHNHPQKSHKKYKR